MGNYISCTLSTPGSKHFRGIKVIFPTGEINKFEQSLKAAELMLEMPSFFVVNTRSLQIGTRFLALNADQELEYGNVYVMFPMKKLNSVVTSADMGALLLTAKRVSAKDKVRILPEITHDIEQDFSMRRLSFCKSKRPLLETIAEEQVC